MRAEPWELKDTLRQMTQKFNDAVDAINELVESNGSVNQATTEKLQELQETIDTDLTQIREELDGKISDVSADDLGLGNVDNTSDMDKPVSTLQRQAIEEATATFASTAEVADDELNTENLYDPAVSTPIKTYIEHRLAELLGTTVDYNIATQEQLGVVKSGTDVLVDQATGKLTVPRLNTLTESLSLLQSSLMSTIESLESNNAATSELHRNQGELPELETADKSSLVAAINSMNAVLDEVNERVTELERAQAD